jgi:hypothetical protein
VKLRVEAALAVTLAAPILAVSAALAALVVAVMERAAKAVV